MSGEKNKLIAAVCIDDDALTCDKDWIKKVTLIITKGCNLTCDYCFEKHFPEQKMDTVLAINKIYKYKPDTVRFFGGEPLVHRDLISKVMDQFPDIKFEITTNGTYIHKLYHEYWHQFSTVNISLDGIYEKDPARWRDEAEFNHVVTNIQDLVGEIGGDNVIINITVNAVSLYSYPLLERIMDISLLTDVQHFDINIVTFDADSNLTLQPKDREEFLKQVYEAFEFSIENNGLYDIGINESVFASKTTSSSCCVSAAQAQVAVDVNGFESFCHVAAYYNVPNSEMARVASVSDAACVMTDVIAKRNDVILTLDEINFPIIEKCEAHNNALYYKRTGQGIVQR